MMAEKTKTFVEVRFVFLFSGTSRFRPASRMPSAPICRCTNASLDTKTTLALTGWSTMPSSSDAGTWRAAGLANSRSQQQPRLLPPPLSSNISSS